MVARKGLGKTLLLKKKATELRKHFHKDEGNVIIHPSNKKDIVEHLRITGIFDAMTDWEWLRKFRSHQHWSDIWEYSIGFLVCRNEGMTASPSSEAVEALEHIHEIFCGSSRNKHARGILGLDNVRDYFTLMATSWNSRSTEFTTLYVKHVAPVLGRLSRLHILFLDSPDESIPWEYSKEDKSVYNSDSSSPDWWALYPDHWIDFNIGFIDALRRIQQKNGNIRIFGCLRVEALNAGITPLMAQYEDMIIRLSYSHDELREIFIQNILLMSDHSEDKELLVDQTITDYPIKNFLGIDKALHVPTGQIEDIFDAILRHTRNTPRDIVRLGKALAEIPLNLRKKCSTSDLDCIRTTINELATIFLNQQRDESIPIWQEAVLQRMDAFCTNLIHRTALRQLSPLTARKNGGCPFDFLYTQGIVGWLGRGTAGNKERINFLDGQKISAKEEFLPESKWYALHPIAYGRLRSFHGDGAHDRRGFLSSAHALVSNGGEIESPSIIRIEITPQGGTIKITGLRILTIPITHCSASLLLMILISHSIKNNTFKFELKEIKSTIEELHTNFSFLSLDEVKKKQINAINDALNGGHDETSKINLWLSTAFGLFPASDFDFQKMTRKHGIKNPEKTSNGRRLLPDIRLRWNKPALIFDGLDIVDLSWSEK